MKKHTYIRIHDNIFIKMNKAKSTKELKIEKVMKEFADGKLKSSDGKIVTDKKQALAIAYDEAKKMEKARSHKYYKRIPKPTGKGYKYYYTKEQYDKSKGEKPEKKEKKRSGIVAAWEALSKFFGITNEKKFREKIQQTYSENEDKLKGVDISNFAYYMNEYLLNKEKWDKKLSKKEVKKDKKTGKPVGIKKDKVPKKDGEKKGFDLNTMRIIAEIVKKGGKEKEDKKGKISVDKLEQFDNDAFDAIGVASGGEIREDKYNAKKYADYIFDKLDEMGVKKLSKNFHEKLENDNYHLLNLVLSLGNYYGKDSQLNSLNFVNKMEKEGKDYYGFPVTAVSRKLLNEKKDDIERKTSIPKEFDRFAELARKFKDPEKSFDEVKKLKDIPYSVSNKFREMYGVGGGNAKEAWRKFVEDVNNSESKSKKKDSSKTDQDKYDNYKNTIESFERLDSNIFDYKRSDFDNEKEYLNSLKEKESELKNDIKEYKKGSRWYNQAVQGLEELKKYRKAIKEIPELKEKLLGPKLFKASLNALWGVLDKAKKMPVGTVSNGRKKVAEGKWVPVKDEKTSQKDEKPIDKKGKKPVEDEKQPGEKTNALKNALKKMATILADMLSGRDTVQPTGAAVEEAGENVKSITQRKKKKTLQGKNNEKSQK